MTVTAPKIEEYFTKYGWTYTAEGDNTWITGVRTRVSAFRIMVRLTDHWIFFLINPLVVAPPNPDDRVRLYYHALRYNLDMNFAKLGVDGDGDLFIAIEIPTEDFTYSHFVDSLDGLSHHATMVYAELFGLAHNPTGTQGRYDDEFNAHTQNMMSDAEQFAATIPFSMMLDEEETDNSDDIVIGGRRLRITDANDGSAKIEFDDDDDPASAFLDNDPSAEG